MKRYLIYQNKPTGAEYMSFDLKKNTDKILLAYEFEESEINDNLKILNNKMLKLGQPMYMKKEVNYA